MFGSLVGFRVISSVLLLFSVATFAGPVAAAASNPVQVENQQSGTRSWELNRPADDNTLQIKGYADASSVNVGNRLNFKVSVSVARPYTLEIYRMGWYGGQGGRLVTTKGPYDGTTQRNPTVDRETGMVTADWSTSASLDVPTDWVSGQYLAKLVRDDGYDNYVPFVVRDDARVADLLVQLPYSTYQAYNNFPADGRTGKSLYDFNSFGSPRRNGPDDQTRSDRVSFDRPYSAHGAGQFFEWDFAAIGWMERWGYDAVYSTSVDTHTDGDRLTDYHGIVSLGHDEYWSAEMYDAAERARDAAGTSLAFFGANAVYWRIEYLASNLTGAANRVIMSERVYDRDRWREQGRPEQQLVGVQYVAPYSNDWKPLVVRNSGHFVWKNAGVSNGNRISGLVGYEIDNLDPSFPGPDTDDQTFLSASPFQGNTHQTSIYRPPSGSYIFASGTMNWSRGLGDPRHPDLESRSIQSATANVLNRFISHGGSQETVRNAKSVQELVRADDYDAQTHGDVLRLYRAFFDREPDVDGARYWIGVRRRSSLIEIADYFTGSEEYANKYGGVSRRQFLERVYRNVLGRDYDQAGFDYWLDILNGTNRSGQNPRRVRGSRGEVVRWVSASSEFVNTYPYR